MYSSSASNAGSPSGSLGIRRFLGLVLVRRRLHRAHGAPERGQGDERPFGVALEPTRAGAVAAQPEALRDAVGQVGALLEGAHRHPERVLEPVPVECDEALLRVLVSDAAAE